MKNLFIILLSITLLISCKKVEPYKVKVFYQNGETEVLIVRKPKIFLNPDGRLYEDDIWTQRTLSLGVRRFEMLPKE